LPKNLIRNVDVISLFLLADIYTTQIPGIIMANENTYLVVVMVIFALAFIYMITAGSNATISSQSQCNSTQALMCVYDDPGHASEKMLCIRKEECQPAITGKTCSPGHVMPGQCLNGKISCSGGYCVVCGC
jgi:hypothetical protein